MSVHESPVTPGIRWLLATLRPHSRSLLLIAIGGAATACLAAAAPYLTGVAIDAVVRDRDRLAPLVLSAVALLASQLLRAAGVYGRQQLSVRTGARIEHDTRRQMITAAVLRSQHRDEPPTPLTGSVMDAPRRLRLMIFPGFDIAIGALSFVLIAIVLAPVYHPALVLAPLLYAAGYGAVMAWHLRQLVRATGTVQERAGGTGQLLEEAVHNLEAVRDSAGQSTMVLDRLRTAAIAQRDASIRQGVSERRAPLFLLLGLAQAVGFGHALFLARADALTVGQLAGYLGLLLLLGAPTFTAVLANPLLAGGLTAAQRIMGLAGQSTCTGPVRARPPSGPVEIAVRGVWLETSPGEQVISEVDIDVPSRGLVVITGPVGSGKSTLARILAGRMPERGEVTVDGTRVEEWDPAALARCVALVSDRDMLFSLSLSGNIRLGRWDAPRRDIVAAAQQVGLDAVAEALPQGYETLVGPEGTELSGGQRQRVTVARALLSRAGALVLDDPLSALDSESARRVAQTLITESLDRVVVVVTDRADLRKAAEFVIHVAGGRAEVVHAERHTADYDSIGDPTWVPPAERGRV